MKAAVLEDIERLAVWQVPDPDIETGAAVVAVKVCSVCGTDLRIYHHGHPRIRLPHILGHEIAGEVVAVGQGVTGLELGDRVAVTPTVACGTCHYCLRGKHVYCLNRRTFGYQLPGGYAEYVFVPSYAVDYGSLNVWTDYLSFEEASLAEPLACCLRAQEVTRVGSADTVVVIGGGPIGMMHCRLAHARGSERVILVERDVSRLSQVDLSAVDHLIDSKRENAEARLTDITEGWGADVVIVACSSVEAQSQGIAMAGRGGRVNFFGGLPRGDARIDLDTNVIHYQEVSIHGTHGSTPADNRAALDLLSRGEIRVADLITHRFDLDSIEAAFKFSESRSGMHVAVRP